MRLGGERVATGRDFDDPGALKGKAVVLDEAAADALADALARRRRRPHGHRRSSRSRTRAARPRRSPRRRCSRRPARKLRFSARETMSVAQSLYENGYITYMRTDSPSLSQQAITAARAQADRRSTAPTSVPDKPRVYTGKSKNAQEAHEAIRPSGEIFRTPSELQSVLRGNEFKLYDLIWKRTVASQMADAKGQTASVTIEVGPTGDARARGATARRRHDRRVHRERHRHHLPRLPRRLRGGPRRGAQRRRRTGRGEAARR